MGRWSAILAEDNTADLGLVTGRPMALTAYRGPVTGPTQKYLVNDNFIYELIEIDERNICI